MTTARIPAARVLTDTEWAALWDELEADRGREWWSE